MVGLLFVVKRLFFAAPGYVDFYLNQSRYENIVRLVKNNGIAPSHLKYWTVDDWRNPTALQELKPDKMPPSLEGRITATRTKNKAYSITIVTLDRGHFGKAGYVYSDGAYKDIDAPGDLWSRDKKINSRWWTVFNDLQ